MKRGESRIDTQGGRGQKMREETRQHKIEKRKPLSGSRGSESIMNRLEALRGRPESRTSLPQCRFLAYDGEEEKGAEGGRPFFR